MRARIGPTNKIKRIDGRKLARREMRATLDIAAGKINFQEAPESMKTILNINPENASRAIDSVRIYLSKIN